MLPAAIAASDLELFRHKLYRPHGTAGDGPCGDIGQITQLHHKCPVQLPPVWWPTHALVGDWLVSQQWPLHQAAHAPCNAPQYRYNGDYGEQLTMSGPWTSLETPSCSRNWMPAAQQERGRQAGLHLPECPKPQVLQPDGSSPAPRKASVAILPGEDEGMESEESDSFSDTSVAPDGRFATGHGLYWQIAGLPLTMAGFPRGYNGYSSEGSEEPWDNDNTVQDQSEQNSEASVKLDRRAFMARSFNAHHNDNPFCKCAFCCSLS